jgi:hypothetical protein
VRRRGIVGEKTHGKRASAGSSASPWSIAWDKNGRRQTAGAALFHYAFAESARQNRKPIWRVVVPSAEAARRTGRREQQ